MNLDGIDLYRQLDRQDMYGEIEHLPDQLATANEISLTVPLDGMNPGTIRKVVITGMGGSAAGADLALAWCQPQMHLPMSVVREYTLPAWAHGDDTLVIASSHSGETEETLSAFAGAQERGCQTAVICTGGRLEYEAQQAGRPVWRFEHNGMPRAAVGYSFALLLGMLRRLQLISDFTDELTCCVNDMRHQTENLGRDVPVVKNPAKRLAGQFFGRWVTVFGSEMLAPVARRWKGQINEAAKAWAQFDELPEGDHNTLAGVLQPEAMLSQMMAIFLRSQGYHPGNLKRSELTRRAFMMEGINTDYYEARGETLMSQMWTTLHFGDYVSYYLAMAYQVDPTPVEALARFKQAMRA